MKKMFKTAVLTLSLIAAGSAFAANDKAPVTNAKAPDAKTAILAKMASVFGGTEVSSVTKVSDVVDKAGIVSGAEKSPMLDLYEVRLDTGARVYTDATGSLWLLSRQGLDFVNTPNDHDIININGIADREQTLKSIKTLGKTIDFIAPKEKAAVTIFIDVQCGYCHKLFDERQTYLDKGISLKFAAAAIFPGSKETMSKIWCSPTEKEDLMAYEKYSAERRTNPNAPEPKLGDGKSSCDTLIDSQSETAKQIGLKGTPMIVLPNGDKLPGYMSADELGKALGL
jgi:thiol:disulfide interchange protein DsbC